MAKILAVLGVLALLVVVLFSSYVGRRNQMVRKNETINAAWSQVDVVLQRRADLIPNLVETVKGYAAQEVTVFGEVANARAALLNARTPGEKIAANNTLDGAIGNFSLLRSTRL
jgi:LemA protein